MNYSNKQKNTSNNLPKFWYVKKLQVLGDIKNIIKQIAKLAKEGDLLNMTENLRKNGFQLVEINLDFLNNLIYIYEIRNFAVCLVSGNKSMGYHVLANISDKKAVYISKFLNTDLIELKYNDGLIFIYGTTTKFQSIKFKDSKK